MADRHCLLGFLVLAVLAGAARGAGEKYEWKEGKLVPMAAPAKGSAAGELAIVRAYFDKGDNRRAVSATKDFLKKYPDDPGREEVMNVAARAEMNRRLFFQAYEWFEKQLQEFPAGELSDNALHKEFDCAEEFLKGTKRVAAGIFYLPAQSDGLEILERIAEHAPGSALAEQALMRVAEYHYGQGEWEDAVQAYDHYLDLFGKSSRSEYARLRAARAMHASYRGSAFDDTPLLDAQQRFKNFAALYPQTAQKENIPPILEQIRMSLAQRSYDTAGFYQRTGKPTVAAFYYKKVVDEFPQTGPAVKARQMLEHLSATTTKLEPKPAARRAPRRPAVSRPATGPDAAFVSKPFSASAPAWGPADSGAKK